MNRAFLAQLYALRTQIDAAIVLAEGELGIQQGGDDGSCPKCKAPSDQVKVTFGGERSCQACGHEWERSA